MTKGIPPLRIPKLSKKHKKKIIKFKRNYTKLIGIGMIVNSNYIVTILSELIKEVNSKENNPIQFIQMFFLLIEILERLIGLAIHY